MQLKEYIECPLNAYLKCERYINDGSPSKNNSTTSENTAPKSSNKDFTLKLIEFSNDIIIEDLGHNISNIPSKAIYIHPDMLNTNILKEQSYIVLGETVVEPTSSGRTVLSKSTVPISFIKLAYPKCLGRLTRHMGKEKILSACEVTDRLIDAIDNNQMNPKFALLKEHSGRIAHIPIHDYLYEWGMIIREYTPYPYINHEEFMMPFFSLFSSEYNPFREKTDDSHVPFLKQFYDNQSKDANTFLLNDIIFPLYDCYFDALLKTGIELEAHAQNMLLSFDNNFKIQRIICRDLESAGRDVTLMERLGINYDLNIKYKCNQLLSKDINEKYAKWYINHSFMFDFKLGEYIITPLLSCASKCIPGVNVEELVKNIKEYNQQYIVQLPDFFPLDWCYYSNENFEKTGNKKVYIWENNPKYR